MSVGLPLTVPNSLCTQRALVCRRRSGGGSGNASHLRRTRRPLAACGFIVRGAGRAARKAACASLPAKRDLSGRMARRRPHGRFADGTAHPRSPRRHSPPSAARWSPPFSSTMLRWKHWRAESPPAIRGLGACDRGPLGTAREANRGRNAGRVYSRRSGCGSGRCPARRPCRRRSRDHHPFLRNDIGPERRGSYPSRP